jgi:hypothetical protein
MNMNGAWENAGCHLYIKLRQSPCSSPLELVTVEEENEDWPLDQALQEMRLLWID